MLYKKNGLCMNYVETGNGPPVHFAHANGFPPGTYENLFKKLSGGYRVLGLNFCLQSPCSRNCPHGKTVSGTWFQFAEELIAFLDTVGEGPCTGVGHSMGGVVTAIASVRRPDLFRKLILLDPVFLEPRLIRIARIGIALGLGRRNPLAVRAEKRKNGWPSREDALNFFKDKKLFGGWEEQALRSYVNNGLTDIGDGVELVCRPEAEAAVFRSYPTNIWKIISTITVPCVVARGGLSDVITDRSWAHLAEVRPDILRVEIPGLGHLFPMQDSGITAGFIMEHAGI